MQNKYVFVTPRHEELKQAYIHNCTFKSSLGRYKCTMSEFEPLPYTANTAIGRIYLN